MIVFVLACTNTHMKRTSPEACPCRKRNRTVNRTLPVFERRDEIVESIATADATIIVGETGSGKTTQVCQFILESIPVAGCIAVSQPRRVAAVSVAARVAEERGEVLGETVGYHVRFASRVGPRTAIKFMTDGMLLRELVADPLLSAYSVIIVDEAHERSARSDLLLGVLKHLKTSGARGDLKVVVMSATLDLKAFEVFFPGCAVQRVPGRQHPVTQYFGPALHHTPPGEDDDAYLELTAAAILQVHFAKRQSSEGHDILAFLPGQAEIERVERKMREVVARVGREIDAARAAGGVECAVEVLRSRGRGENEELLETFPSVLQLLIVPIYAALPLDRQQRVFERTPEGFRKVVLATNIAETSITIPGIRYVVDSGKVKVKEFDPATGVETLRLRPVSKTMSNQRAGRAGRVGPGEAFKIYSMESYNALDAHLEPEIARSDLSQVVLTLKALGFDDVAAFPFLTPPSAKLIARAIANLQRLGGLDRSAARGITPLGHRFLALPLPPHMAKFLVESVELQCTSEAVTVTAMLCTDTVWRDSWKGAAGLPGPAQTSHVDALRKKVQSPDGDHLSLLNAYSMWEKAGDPKALCKLFSLQHRSFLKAKDIRQQLKEIMTTEFGLRSLPSCGDNTKPIRQALARSFLFNIARYDPSTKSYHTLADRQRVKVHPTSLYFAQEKPDAVVFSESVKTQQSYIRELTPIDPAWVAPVYPEILLPLHARDELSRPPATKSSFLSFSSIRKNCRVL
eukprot:Polyplicarium_translucidae@DN3381_c1_g2_i1.p1